MRSRSRLSYSKSNEALRLRS